MDNEHFEDVEILCVDCNPAKRFVWTAGEREFWRLQGWATPPKRCKTHRHEKKARLTAREGDGARRFLVDVRPVTTE